jgi:hypothetical protein
MYLGFVMFVSSSVCSRVTNEQPRNRFTRNFILASFSKIYTKKTQFGLMSDNNNGRFTGMVIRNPSGNVEPLIILCTPRAN